MIQNSNHYLFRHRSRHPHALCGSPVVLPPGVPPAPGGARPDQSEGGGAGELAPLADQAVVDGAGGGGHLRGKAGGLSSIEMATTTTTAAAVTAGAAAGAAAIAAAAE